MSEPKFAVKFYDVCLDGSKQFVTLADTKFVSKEGLEIINKTDIIVGSKIYRRDTNSKEPCFYEQCRVANYMDIEILFQ